MSGAVDVLIAGAGPGGCATALGCARRGLEVLVVERARFPRDKACGEGLLPSGVAALARLGLAGTVRRFAQPLEGVGFAVDADDAPLAYARFADGEGLGVRRVQFDALLAAAVRAEPTATLLEGVTAHAPLVEDGAVVGLHTDVGDIRARVVVVADGLRSSLRARLGLARASRGNDERARVGLRGHFAVGRAPFGPSVRVLVGGALEYYLTPLAGGQLQVAVLGPARAFASAGLSAATFYAHVRAHPRLGPLLDGAAACGRPLGAGPFRQRVRRLVRDGALLVGDAAGYVDAITGEGMGAALRQGLAAAAVLADAVAAAGRARAPLPARALEPYARAHARLVRDGNRLTEAVLLLARHPSLARRAIAFFARHPSLLERLVAVETRAPELALGY